MNKAFLNLTLYQIIFLVAATIVVALIVVFLIVLPIRKFNIKNKFDNYCYKKINKLVQIEDYYLINNFDFIIEGNRKCHIDHIVFGEKYIFVINCLYLNGDITGKIDDNSLIVVPKKGDRFYLDNPINMNKYVASKLSANTGIDSSFLIGINIVNDECKIAIENPSKQFYLVQLNRVAELIKNIESRNVGKLNEQALDNAVQEISSMNRSKKQ